MDKLSTKNRGNTTIQEVNEKVLEAAAAILDFKGGVALDYGEYKVTWPDFIVLDDCASIIGDPDYSEGGIIPDIEDIESVKAWLEYRATLSSTWDMYAPADGYFSEKYYTKSI